MNIPILHDYCPPALAERYHMLTTIGLSVALHGLVVWTFGWQPGWSPAAIASPILQAQIIRSSATKPPSRPPQPVTALPAVAAPVVATLPSDLLADNSPPVATEFVAPDYLPPDRVDQPAHVIMNEALPLPPDDSTPSGHLYLKVAISETGAVNSIEILTSSLPPDYAALLAERFQRARFVPAMHNGRATNSWSTIEIRLEPIDEPSTSDRRQG